MSRERLGQGWDKRGTPGTNGTVENKTRAANFLLNKKLAAPNQFRADNGSLPFLFFRDQAFAGVVAGFAALDHVVLSLGFGLIGFESGV
jgi:hypothetical protein